MRMARKKWKMCTSLGHPVVTWHFGFCWHLGCVQRSGATYLTATKLTTTGNRCVEFYTEPTLASCSFDKHGVILIILSKQHQHTFKNYMHIELAVSLSPIVRALNETGGYKQQRNADSQPVNRYTNNFFVIYGAL